MPISSHLPFLPSSSPCQLLIYFVALWICMFCAFYVNRTVKYVPFCVWFLYLAYVSRLTHVVTCGRAPFLPMAEEHSIAWVSHILPIHAPLDECFDCFHFLAIINNAAVNICVWVCVWKYAFSFLGNAPRSGIAGSYGSSVTVFEELPNRGPKWLHFTFPPAVCVGSRFSTALSAPVLSTFWLELPLGHEEVSHWGFDVIIFPSELMMLSIFHVLVGYLYIFFRELSIEILCSFLIGSFLFIIEL